MDPSEIATSSSRGRSEGVRMNVLSNTGENVRRRHTGRVDGLRHLATTTEEQNPERLRAIREIVLYILRLDSVGREVLYTAHSRFPMLFRPIYKEYDQVLSTSGDIVPLQPNDDIGSQELYEPRMRTWILSHVAALNLDELLKCMRAQGPCQFYSDILHIQMNMVELLEKALDAAPPAYINYADIPDWYIGGRDMKRSIRTQDYISMFRVDCEDHRYRLAALVKIIRGLRGSIQRAAEASFLTDDLLVALKAKLEPFQDQYASACRTHGIDFEWNLIDSSSEQWWIPAKGKADSEPDDDTAAEAYPMSSAMRSSLNFVVPTVSLLSVVPAALAWKYGSNQPGSARDSAFNQTVAGSTMQLLGLVTFIWPTLSHPRLSRLTWFWIWILAGFSAVCSLLSIALYITVSSTWSFVVAFAGVLAQAIVQLQVINAI